MEIIVKPLYAKIVAPNSVRRGMIIHWEQTVIDGNNTETQMHAASFGLDEGKTSSDLTQEYLVEKIKTHEEYQRYQNK